ncbi:hypothetical protein PV04_04036 [Phialophora macrospora]|uniref:Uncharacterized protein n=1 Tax=Phialophora macrospora TaxID=1851006 RepID=A0A0D2E168_9EURO|nr:hypothetical protein PV04_04036 [Phialophora macrospora]
MGSGKGKCHIKLEEISVPPQTMSGPRAPPSGPRFPEARSSQQHGSRSGNGGGGRGRLRSRGGGIEKQRAIEPAVEIKYASLAAKCDQEKRSFEARIKDQSEIIGNLENDKYRLQEQNTVQQASIADLEKKLVKKNKTIDQQARLISQQEKALATMAMKFALGDVDTTGVRTKIERD